MNKKLNQKIFKDKQIKENVRQKLLEIAFNFYDYVNQGLELPIQSITLTGSNCQYHYNSDSDLDVHIIINFSKIDVVNKLLLKSLIKSK